MYASEAHVSLFLGIGVRPLSASVAGVIFFIIYPHRWFIISEPEQSLASA
jgi:hypothetical protein